jgi:hypothetical protein
MSKEAKTVKKNKKYKSNERKVNSQTCTINQTFKAYFPFEDSKFLQDNQKVRKLIENWSQAKKSFFN